MAAITETKVADYSEKQVYVGSGAGNLSKAHASVAASTAIAATAYATFMTLPAGSTLYALEVVCSASLGATATLTLKTRPKANAGTDTGAVTLTAAIDIAATTPVRTAFVPQVLTVDTDIIGLVSTAALGAGGASGVCHVTADYKVTGI